MSLQRRWPASPGELIEAQLALAAADPPAPWTLSQRRELAIGACAVIFPRRLTGPGARGDRAWAAAAVLRDRRVIAQATVLTHAGAAYIAGLLALREGAALEAAVRPLAEAPDVLLVDGTGRDHPRRAGMALHLGAVLGLPTVGVTHRPLLAEGGWPEDMRGAASPLRLDGETVGAWLRTTSRTRPLAVHPGWRTDVETAVDVVLSATFGHRTPEPFRVARRLARTARAGARGG
ncbi:MAG: endonuclease V [Solirubrobacterales bacterium]|nr:endonuclease V [Solirubrobacterales bacterium]